MPNTIRIIGLDCLENMKKHNQENRPGRVENMKKHYAGKRAVNLGVNDVTYTDVKGGT